MYTRSSVAPRARGCLHVTRKNIAHAPGVLDDLGSNNTNYKKWVDICHLCYKTIDTTVQHHPSYLPPVKRKRISESSSAADTVTTCSITSSTQINSEHCYIAAAARKTPNSGPIHSKCDHGLSAERGATAINSEHGHISSTADTETITPGPINSQRVYIVFVGTPNSNAQLISQKIKDQQDTIKELQEQLRILKDKGSFAQLLNTFQRALYTHYEKGGEKLNQPDVVQAFCEKHSPGLWPMVLEAIAPVHGSGLKRIELQRQRVASLLHTLSYFKNQKNSHMVKDSGLFLHQRGLTKSGQAKGSILGCSVSNSALRRHKKQLSELKSTGIHGPCPETSCSK